MCSKGTTRDNHSTTNTFGIFFFASFFFCAIRFCIVCNFHTLRINAPEPFCDSGCKNTAFRRKSSDILTKSTFMGRFCVPIDCFSTYSEEISG